VTLLISNVWLLPRGRAKRLCSIAGPGVRRTPRKIRDSGRRRQWPTRPRSMPGQHL